MTNQHPITPPPELVPQWRMDAWQARVETMGADVPTILLEIAQWGWDQREPEIQAAADAELEACCKWLQCEAGNAVTEFIPGDLRAARRPKPPSLKKQALNALSRADKDALTDPLTGGVVALRTILNKDQADTIRRALEALPNDQH